MKIRSRIAITFGGVFLFVIIIIGTLIIYRTDVILTRQIKNSLLLSSDIKSEKITTFLQSQKKIIELMAGSQVFRDFLKTDPKSENFDFQREQSKKRLDRSIVTDKNYSEMSLLDKNGIVALSTDSSMEGTDKSKDLYFTEAKKEAYIKSVYLSESTGKISYALSAPILDDTTQEFFGTIVIRVNTESLLAVINTQATFGETGENFLINRNLYLLTPSLFLKETDVLNKKIDTQNAKECYANTKDQSFVENYIDYRGVKIVGTHKYIPEADWCLITKIDRSEIYQPVTNNAMIILFSALIGTILSFAIGLVVSKKISSPIEKLYVSVNKITKEGDLNQKVGTDSKDEIGELSRSFDKMTESIIKSRAEIETKVKEQTSEIIEKERDIENQQKATLNILDDVQLEKTRYEALLTGIGDGIIATDSQTKITVINPAAEKILGLKKEEVYGKNLVDVFTVVDEKGQLIPESERPINMAVSSMKSVSTSVNSNIFYSRRDGVKIPVALNASPVVIGEKLFGVIDVFRDISHEKDVDRMKTEFISLSSHQLRTPLSAIKWFGEMLLAGDVGKLTDEQKEFVDNIYQSTERMIALVNSLLNISRIESGRIIIDPQPTQLPDLVNNVIKEVKNKIDEKGQHLITSFHPDLPNINIDPKLITEVYKNLLTNSIKYTPKGGDISIFISKNDKEIISQVTDNGYGIPEKDQKKVFEKFYRGENIIKLETEGTGLGLYLVKAVVESSGGRVWFESKEKLGTTFWFALPLTESISKSGEVTINT